MPQCNLCKCIVEDLRQHLRLVHDMGCPCCAKAFDRKYNLERHIYYRHSVGDLTDSRLHHVGIFGDSPHSSLFDQAANSNQANPAILPESIQSGGAPSYNNIEPTLEGPNFVLKKTGHKSYAEFRAVETEYSLRFKEMAAVELDQVLEILHDTLDSVLNHIFYNVQEWDKLRLILQSPRLDFPIVIPVTTIKELNAQYMLDQISHVLQSYQDFTFDQGVLVSLTHIMLPQPGNGRELGQTRRLGNILTRSMISLPKWLLAKRCILQVKSTSNCLGHAVVIGRAIVDHVEAVKDGTVKPRLGKRKQDRTLNNLKRSDCSSLTREKEVLQLYEACNIESGQPCGLDQINRVQVVLSDYQLNIWSAEKFGQNIFAGAFQQKQINLLYHNAHYDVITKMSAFMNTVNYCPKCRKGYSTAKNSHRCSVGCLFCRYGSCTNKSNVSTKTPGYCKHCNRYWLTEACFQNHQSFICQNYKCCEVCHRIVPSKHLNDHSCGLYYCTICRTQQPSVHKCFIQPIREKQGTGATNTKMQKQPLENLELANLESAAHNFGKPRFSSKYFVFDFESMILPDGQHQPNLCVVQTLEKDAKQWVFSGDDCSSKFCTWVFSADVTKNSTFIAHNFGGYDGYFILEYLHENAIKPDIIYRGGKILTLSVFGPGVRFIDSYNFFGIPLAKLPKTFGLAELKKGFFPYLFNTPENQSYSGVLPDLKYFDVQSRKLSEYKELISWYDQERSRFDADSQRQYCLQKEMLDYCISDVNILRQACLIFCSDFFEATHGVDPFEHSITMASACNRVFRRNFLEEQTIAIIPPLGYSPKRNYSKSAIGWLKWHSFKTGQVIRHALNGGEVKIGSFYVDGFHEKTDGNNMAIVTAYEFYGCYYHGCPCLQKNPNIDKAAHADLVSKYQRTLERRTKLLAANIQLVEIWQCEFKQKLASDLEFKKFVAAVKFDEPLKPRDAFMGGRTNAIRLYYTVENRAGEVIRYIDITSLYPWVNANCKYPVGHPRIITEGFQPVSEYFGLVKCSLLPPRGLFHPVISYRANGKLMFPLCRTCAENQLQEKCEHSDKERLLSGTWCTPELHKALSLGYHVVKISEVWHWEEQSSNIFKGYVKAFLKMKQEASGWPKDCVTDQQRINYVENYGKIEGVDLEPGKIAFNAGKRAIAKLNLNCLWGYMGKRNNVTHTTYATNYADLLNLLTNVNNEVTDLLFLKNGSMVQVSYRISECFAPLDNKTNVVLAAFTTSYARLKLYSYLEQLGDKVLYMDTDSIVYISKANEISKEPVLGNYLGDMKDEISENYGSGSKIIEFWSLGPKNYGYTVEKADGTKKQEWKVKGIPLNVQTCSQLNPESMRRVLFQKDPIQISQSSISKNKKTVEIKSVQQTKNYRLVYDKRCLLPDFTTLPYGY